MHSMRYIRNRPLPFFLLLLNGYGADDLVAHDPSAR